MDASPLYREPFHQLEVTQRRDWKGTVSYCRRTEQPVKYYIIDFGLSRKFEPDGINPLANIIIGADNSVPEHQCFRKYRTANPFATDIYTAGSLFNEFFALMGCYAVPSWA